MTQENGSSPRMRGIRKRARLHPLRLWFIPADAGNTMTRLTSLKAWTVHPRGCGEYCTGRAWCDFVSGSSPRMRGIRVRNPNHWRVRRFIPADAGNTVHAKKRHEAQSVHPRGCGEYIHLIGVDAPFGGSSPRMRGILGEAHWLQVRQRFIPADAGNTTARAKP